MLKQLIDLLGRRVRQHQLIFTSVIRKMIRTSRTKIRWASLSFHPIFLDLITSIPIFQILKRVTFFEYFLLIFSVITISITIKIGLSLLSRRIDPIFIINHLNLSSDTSLVNEFEIFVNKYLFALGNQMLV